MYSVEYTTKFSKDFKIAQKRGLDISKLRDVMKKLERRHCEHILKGNPYDGDSECHVSPDWLLIYRYIGKDKLLFVRTGTHSDLFR